MIESTKTASIEKLNKIKEKLEMTFIEEKYQDVCVYACGSLGRLEMTRNSDLDLFFVSMHSSDRDPMKKNLNRYLFFGKMYDINREMGFPDPSKEGEYWEFINKEDFLDIGSRKEDFNNSFTTRLLLILESKPIYNEDAYNRLVKETVYKYFTDYEEHKNPFYPLFLMNDIQRYWYTLTLNYEYRRDEKDNVNKKNWKRLKLKYARLITCFSMLACLYHKNITPDYVIKCINMTPFERLDSLAAENSSIIEIVEKIKTEYEWFLSLRKNNENRFDDKDFRDMAFQRADKFHNLVVGQLLGRLSQVYPELRNKADVY